MKLRNKNDSSDQANPSGSELTHDGSKLTISNSKAVSLKGNKTIFKIGCNIKSRPLKPQEGPNSKNQDNVERNEVGISKKETQKRKQSSVIVNALCHETAKYHPNGDMANYLETPSHDHLQELKLHGNVDNPSQGRLKDFVPVTMFNTIIPEIFRQKFPEPKNREGLFVCKWCKRSRAEVNKAVYSDSMYLVRHYINHHSEIPVKDYNIQCQDCKAYFFHEKRLEVHKQNGSCYVKHFQNDCLDAGMALTKDAFMTNCPHCDMIFLSMKRFRKHLCKDGNSCRFENMTDHPREMGMFDYMKCKFCGEIFLFESDFKLHLLPQLARSDELFKCRTVSKLIFKCSVCEQQYFSEQRYRQHLLVDHSVEEFDLKCDKCGKYFHTETRLREHNDMMSWFPHCFDYDDCRTIPKGPEVDESIFLRLKAFECPVCNRKFHVKQRVVAHLKKHHPDFKSPLNCSDCGMTFITVRDYEDHMTKWKCPFCGDILNSKAMLTTHCRKKHATAKGTKAKEFVCDICGKTEPSENLLQRHKSTVHHDIIECPFCGEEDNPRQMTMINHISKHAYKDNSDNKFQCELCENKPTYASKSQLKLHIYRTHDKKDVTNCDICNRTFSQKASMMRHRRIHLDIKPFKCNICGVAFTQKTGMKSHKARHFNKDGSLKSTEEIKQQAEVIQQQRETMKIGDPREGRKKKGNYGKKKFKCDECRTEFKTKKEFESHSCVESDGECESEQSLSDVGEGDKKPLSPVDYDNRCHLCKLTFATEKSLARHRCKAKKMAQGGENEKSIKSDKGEIESRTDGKETEDELKNNGSPLLDKKENSRKRKSNNETKSHKKKCVQRHEKETSSYKKLLTAERLSNI